MIDYIKVKLFLSTDAPIEGQPVKLECVRVSVITKDKDISFWRDEYEHFDNFLYDILSPHKFNALYDLRKDFSINADPVLNQITVEFERA